MIFKMEHNFFDTEPELFHETNAPDWLTGTTTVKGSTMDCRWFWERCVLTLGVGESIKTDFRTIIRTE